MPPLSIKKAEIYIREKVKMCILMNNLYYTYNFSVYFAWFKNSKTKAVF